MRYLMLLNDGETFTDINGCAIVGVRDDAGMEEIEELLRIDAEVTIAVFEQVDRVVDIALNASEVTASVKIRTTQLDDID